VWLFGSRIWGLLQRLVQKSSDNDRLRMRTRSVSGDCRSVELIYYKLCGGIKMKRIRSYYDADFEDNLPLPTNHLTKQNQNELFCSMCGDNVFVNDLIFDEVIKMLEKTSENPFLCAECIEEFEEAAYR
jgi:hypothetical protein